MPICRPAALKTLTNGLSVPLAALILIRTLPPAWLAKEYRSPNSLRVRWPFATTLAVGARLSAVADRARSVNVPVPLSRRRGSRVSISGGEGLEHSITALRTGRKLLNVNRFGGGSDAPDTRDGVGMHADAAGLPEGSECRLQPDPRLR